MGKFTNRLKMVSSLDISLNEMLIEVHLIHFVKRTITHKNSRYIKKR